MKFFILTISLLAASNAFSDDKALTTKDLISFSGDWKVTEGAQVQEMYISPPAGGIVMGMDRMIANGQLAFGEFFKIEDVDGKLVLKPYPFEVLAKGKVPVQFLLQQERSVPKKAVFENLDHDWPKTITYELTGQETLQLTVEGVKPNFPPKIVTTYTRWKR